jgi:hypothetical protein
MVKILVALIVAAFVFIVAAALSGMAVQTNPAQLGTHQGPEKGTLRLVPW